MPNRCVKCAMPSYENWLKNSIAKYMSTNNGALTGMIPKMKIIEEGNITANSNRIAYVAPDAPKSIAPLPVRRSIPYVLTPASVPHSR